jgi:nucleoside-diphosphate kinase
VINRFERRGYKLVGMKFMQVPDALAQEHYGEHKGKKFFESLISYITSGPVCAMVWEGKEVVKTSRMMVGATNPLNSAPGTIRGDFAIDVGRNIIHGSDSVETAKREAALWFKEEELFSWEPLVKAMIYE